MRKSLVVAACVVTSSLSACSMGGASPDAAPSDNATPEASASTKAFNQANKESRLTVAPEEARGLGEPWKPALSAEAAKKVVALRNSPELKAAEKLREELAIKCVVELGHKWPPKKLSTSSSQLHPDGQRAQKALDGASTDLIRLPSGNVDYTNGGCRDAASKALFGGGERWAVTTAYVDALVELVDSGKYAAADSPIDNPEDHPVVGEWMSLRENGVKTTQNAKGDASGIPVDAEPVRAAGLGAGT